MEGLFSPVTGQPDRFTAHLPTFTATAGAAVIAPLALGYLGIAGTAMGTVISTLLAGIAAWWADRALRRAAALARARTAAIRRRGRPLTDSETQLLVAVVDRDLKRRRHIPWKLVSLSCTGALALAAGSVTVAEMASGSPVSAVVSRPPTLTGPLPPPAATSPAPLPSSSPVITITPSPSLDPVPAVTPSITLSASPGTDPSSQAASAAATSPPVTVSPDGPPSP